MELKVWVEGIQRIVCGVTEATTCQDVVYALAHATGKTGRFTLIERWRNNERLLTPQEHPLKVVSKWGEYSSEVQLILQRSSGWNTNTCSPSKNLSQNQQQISSTQQILQNSNQLSPPSSQQEVNIRKDVSMTMSVDDNITNNKLHLKQDMKTSQNNSNNHSNKEKEEAVYSSRYRDLVRLVNFQRDKLATQQAEIAKYDAEIGFWESKAREQKHQMEFIVQETQRYQSTITNNEMKLRGFGSIEEERDLILQQERTLKSELTLLRSKLANSETELLQCKNKIRLLGEELECEDRVKEDVKEIDRLQKELEQARHTSELTTQACRNITHQIENLESVISEKKKMLEKLVNDMKEANLQSLSISPAEEIKLLLEGSHKPGSTRRMIGSPRQLENAVPTSKNPHGVWV